MIDSFIILCPDGFKIIYNNFIDMTWQKITLKLREFFEAEEEEPQVSFRSEYRIWPFVMMYIVGFMVGYFSTWLSPAPDSPHFIDPTLKFGVVFILFIVLAVKPTAIIAKK